MASSSIGTIIGVAAAAGAAYLVYQYFFATPATVAAPAGTAPAMGATAVPVPAAGTTVPAMPLSIPAGLTVTSDINNSLKGTVNWNNANVTLNVIPGNAGGAGVVWSSAGVDITAQFTPAQQQQLIAAFSTAPRASIAGAPLTAAQTAQAQRIAACLALNPLNPACAGLSGFGAPHNYIRGGPMGLPHYFRRAA